MKTKFRILMVGLTLAACDTNGAGTGLTQAGAPVVVTIQGTALSKGFSTAMIHSPAGWTCQGNYSSENTTENPLTFEFPLTCDNGATGKAFLTLNTLRGGLTGTLVFSLSNGEQGSALVDIA